MNRRQFLLHASLAGAALALPGLIRASENTASRFHKAEARNPRYAAFEGVSADLEGAATITGAMPADLRGVFYRNGPARFELGGERYEHWFDGDGMVHRWEIGEQGIKHRGRFVQTSKFVEESKAGRFLLPSFGTPIAGAVSGRSGDSFNTANTNAVFHNGKLYALWEGGSAYEMDPASLDTVGSVTWRDDLKAMPFSAHPKFDQDGTWWSFGAFNGHLALYRIDAAGQLVQFRVHDIPGIGMLHDFVISERYLIFLVPPYRTEREAPDYLDMQVWHGNEPMRALVFDKNSLELKRTIELDAAMVFHFGNAWDDGRHVVLDFCLFKDDSILQDMRHTMRGEPMSPLSRGGQAVQLRLDLERGKGSLRRLLAHTEFPRVDPRRTAQRHGDLFLLTSQLAAETVGMSGVGRFDLSRDRFDGYDFGPEWIVEEHVPVPKRRGDGGVWLIGVAYDVRQKQSVLNIFDGAHVAAGPVAQARLPYAAPLCFHGNIVAT